MESDKRIKIEGEGHLINKDSSKLFPVRFEVEQIRTGKISGKCTLSGFKYEDILTQSQFKKSRITSGNLIKINGKWYEFEDVLYYFRNFSIEGETDNRDNVIIKDIFTYSCQINDSSSSSERRTLNLEFSAREVEVVYETISSKDQLWIEYGIINLDLRRLLQGYIESDIGKITFSKWKDHEEVIEEMKTFKTPLLSGLLNITDVNIGNFESFDSYFKTVKEIVENVLELLSLAQSTYLSYCSICIYAKTPNSNSQDDYELKRMIMLDIKTKAPSLGRPLIKDWGDIYNFISPKTIRKYSDLKEKFDLDIALEWYLESLSHGVLQSDYLLACTCLELLKDRYNKEKGNEYIIHPKKLFDKKGYKYLKNKTSEMLKVIGINEGSTEHENIKKEIDENLISINRTSFKNSLLRLLEDYRIIYNDLFPYSFSWDNVPGNDSEKLISWLMADYDISWAERAEISKSDDGKTIHIFEDENSAEILIDEKEEKATLKISDGRIRDIEVKKENGKLNLYPFPNIKVIPKIRNRITHRGIQEISTEELSDVYERLICLIQRIFLALLGYDGYFLEYRNDRYERKKFTDFIKW